MNVAIPRANGRQIRCPECGTPAPVRPAKVQMGTVAPELVQSHGWWLVDCPRSGKKLYPFSQVVDLIVPEVEKAHV